MPIMMRQRGSGEMVPVIESPETGHDYWTPRDPNAVFGKAFRVWNGKLYRREVGSHLAYGIRVTYVPLGSRLAAEWLNDGPIKMGEPMGCPYMKSSDYCHDSDCPKCGIHE